MFTITALGTRGKCPEPYTHEEKLVNCFAAQLQALVIPPAVVEWLQQELVASDVAEQAARAQTIRRHQIELERLQARLDILYEDRLDGRIDASKYDLKAEETRGQQHRVQINITQCQSADLAPAAAAVDLISLTSKAAELFERQCAIEQRRLLRLVVQAAIWQEGELRDVLPGRLSNCDYRTLQLPQKTSTSRQMR